MYNQGTNTPTLSFWNYLSKINNLLKTKDQKRDYLFIEKVDFEGIAEPLKEEFLKLLGRLLEKCSFKEIYAASGLNEEIIDIISQRMQHLRTTGTKIYEDETTIQHNPHQEEEPSLIYFWKLCKEINNVLSGSGPAKINLEEQIRLENIDQELQNSFFRLFAQALESEKLEVLCIEPYVNEPLLKIFVASEAQIKQHKVTVHRGWGLQKRLQELSQKDKAQALVNRPPLNSPSTRAKLPSSQQSDDTFRNPKLLELLATLGHKNQAFTPNAQNSLSLPTETDSYYDYDEQQLGEESHQSQIPITRPFIQVNNIFPTPSFTSSPSSTRFGNGSVEFNGTSEQEEQPGYWQPAASYLGPSSYIPAQETSPIPYGNKPYSPYPTPPNPFSQQRQPHAAAAYKPILPKKAPEGSEGRFPSSATGPYTPFSNTDLLPGTPIGLQRRSL